MTQTTCPECQIPFSTQGLSSHREASHGVKPMTKAQARRQANRAAIEAKIRAMSAQS